MNEIEKVFGFDLMFGELNALLIWQNGSLVKTIDFEKLVNRVSDPHRYIVEELDTPWLSADSIYTVLDGKVGDEGLVCKTTNEFIAWIDMILKGTYQ